MTNENIKKAFNQMKKELEKETGIKGGFVMNKRQIEKRTATYTVCYNQPYDETIDRIIRDDVKVQSYDTWTPEEKANAHKRAMEAIKYVTEREEKFGTIENEVEQTHLTIYNSKAFANFERAIGNAICITKEIDNDNCYKLRFYY